MTESQCDSNTFVTPVGETVNQLVWGDIDKGEAGVLVKMADIMENLKEWTILKTDNHEYLPSNPDQLHHIPVSHLHGSMKSKNGFFFNDVFNFGMLIGTKYRKNTVMHKFQEGGRFIDAITYYPVDAGTLERGVLMDKDGIHCLDSYPEVPICVGQNCLATAESQCGPCSVTPEEFGDLVARYIEVNKASKWDTITYQTCWYRTVKDMITASNSLWKERRRWYKHADEPASSFRYFGYTECLANNSLHDIDLIDAIVLPLLDHGQGDSMSNSTTLCTANFLKLNNVALEEAYRSGYGDLPVVVYREVKGMPSTTECERLWNGTDCDDGYRKEFFSQEVVFPTGACLHRPPGCEETYYFPVVDLGNETYICSAFTELGKGRIEHLCEKEQNLTAHIVASAMKKNKSIHISDSNRTHANVRGHRANSTWSGSTFSEVLASWLQCCTSAVG